MKDFVNFWLRLMVKACLHLYFKKIKVQGKSNIPANRPVILVANHQNALIDPLLLATHTRLNPFFLTRASVFKNPIAAKLLDFIRMLPVYRVRDGFSTIQQNQQIFDKTYEILKKNGTVIIFAEGSHSNARNLRTLSKGFTRMAFGLKEKYPHTEPVILPVGINYSSHRKSGSRVEINFGKTIEVDMPNSQSGKLTKAVEKALHQLVVEIPNENYEENLKALIDHGVDLTDKEAVEKYLQTGTVDNPIDSFSGLKNKLMKIFHFPLYLIWLWRAPKIKDKVFDSTIKFLIGFALGPLYYLVLLMLALGTGLGSWALAFLIMAVISLWGNKNPQE
ncbi:1-acyl-sn-glycerol-3-phosphate acyltransferase [Algoriphagus pacificus]|uniref:1-acyl-sn-glycerol-3-phosphate acyltransferase n=1 Tax=Algoriphagus pacificus TaxID=2811234 RepID=A0ABS3CKC3_9BACT|nr:1-acyl-sn-glycerol-3-phosphate acyltransferase [Algoriphagus pacificus]MBN7816616.1 1-acyl-sn-glycerol-3-phosphate acyltransferase [Algoriphagus pacificus]